jgi:hypothetical protein
MHLRLRRATRRSRSFIRKPESGRAASGGTAVKEEQSMCCMMGHGMDHGAATASAGAAPPESLLEVLRRRYALGEISRDQLEEMKVALGLSEGKAFAAAAGSGSPWEAEHHA